MIDLVAAAVAVLVGLGAIVAALVRWVVMPNLREHLFGPVAETNRQVTQNGHVEPRAPTVLDRIDQLTDDLHDLTSTVDAIGLTQSAVLRVAQRIRRMEARFTDHEQGHTAKGVDPGVLRLVIESLIHQEATQPKGTPNEPVDP